MPRKELSVEPREVLGKKVARDRLPKVAAIHGHANTNELATYEHVVLEDA